MKNYSTTEFTADTIKLNTVNFDKILSPTDNDTQKIAEKLDELVLGGVTINSINWLDLVNLVNIAGLIPNEEYHIADYPNHGSSDAPQVIVLKAISTTAFSSEMVMRTKIVDWNKTKTDSLGVWHSGLTFSVNQYVIWGHKHWKNLTGNVGTAQNNYTLDTTNWVLVPLTDPIYIEKEFVIDYDVLSNSIRVIKDEYGNEIVGWTYEYCPLGNENFIENKINGDDGYVDVSNLTGYVAGNIINNSGFDCNRFNGDFVANLNIGNSYVYLYDSNYATISGNKFTGYVSVNIDGSDYANIQSCDLGTGAKLNVYSGADNFTMSKSVLEITSEIRIGNNVSSVNINNVRLSNTYYSLGIINSSGSSMSSTNLENSNIQVQSNSVILNNCKLSNVGIVYSNTSPLTWFNGIINMFGNSLAFSESGTQGDFYITPLDSTMWLELDVNTVLSGNTLTLPTSVGLAGIIVLKGTYGSAISITDIVNCNPNYPLKFINKSNQNITFTSTLKASATANKIVSPVTNPVISNNNLDYAMIVKFLAYGWNYVTDYKTYL